MEYVIRVTQEDIGVLDEALKVLPYYKVAALIAKINEQINDTSLNTEHHDNNISEM